LNLVEKKVNGIDGNHRNLRTGRRMSSQNGHISLVKQGKFKVGAVPA
jgi:hypothetical protein